jgi:hypothetical protein
LKTIVDSSAIFVIKTDVDTLWGNFNDYKTELAKFEAYLIVYVTELR